jgi:DNA-binding XRE family transcriptional regulator
MIEKLNKIRKEKRIKKQDLAEELGLNRYYMGDILEGRSKASWHLVVRIAEVLGHEIILVRK